MELYRASEMFGKFNSGHEGYAIIAEEVDELNDEINFLNSSKAVFWNNLKCNNIHINDIENIECFATNAIYEAIQVAAMARRYKSDMSGVVECIHEWEYLQEGGILSQIKQCKKCKKRDVEFD
jgi:hypothetical protein